MSVGCFSVRKLFVKANRKVQLFTEGLKSWDPASRALTLPEMG
jgi:hypothetical protein